MKKLKKEKFKFNREYIKPMTGGLILFVLIVILLIVFGYNPSEEGNKNEERKDNYSLDLNDKTISDVTCDSDIVKSIKSDLSNISVKVSVTEVEGEEVEDAENSTPEDPVYFTEMYTAYKIVFGGLTENLKVIVDNSINTDSNTLSKDTNSFITTIVATPVKYNVKVYSNNEKCKDVLVREFDFTTPMYNVYSDLALCADNDSPECDALIYSSVDISKISRDYEIKVVENNTTQEKKKTNYVLIICIGVGLVLLVGIVIYIVYRNRRKRMVI